MTNSSAQPQLFQLAPYRDRQTLRDTQDFMAVAFFASEKGPSVFTMEVRIATGRDDLFVRLKGNEDGIATMWDKRVLMYIQTLLMQAINDGKEISRRVTFSPYDYFQAIGRKPGKGDYEQFTDSLKRLKGTTIETDLSAGVVSALDGVGYIDSYHFRKRETAKGEINAGVTVVLSEWLFEMLTSTDKALSVDPDYFKLTSGIEMRLYELCRKFVGHQDIPVRMNLELLHMRVNGGRGRSLDIKYAINRIHKRGGILGYDIEVEEHKKRTPASRIIVRMSRIKGPRRIVG